MKKVIITMMVVIFFVIPVFVSAVAHSSEESIIEDAHLFSFRTARAVNKDVQSICIEFVAQEEMTNLLEFPEDVGLYEIPPDGGYRTAGSTHCGGDTCGVTDCHTNGCYTCYPSAACYQTCINNPCTYDHCPTSNGPTCEGGQTCGGTCPGNGATCNHIPCQTGWGLKCLIRCICKCFCNDIFLE